MLSTDFQPLMFAAGTASVLIVPGPTNTLLAAAGLATGVRRAWPLVGAELAGYLIAIAVWGRALAPLERGHPALIPGIRLASALYLAWLAVNVWRAARHAGAPRSRAVTLRTLFVATLLNPKALFFATMFPASAFASPGTYLTVALLFACLAVPIGLGWMAFGQILGTRRLGRDGPALVQRVLAAALGAFSASLAWSALQAMEA